MYLGKYEPFFSLMYSFWKESKIKKLVNDSSPQKYFVYHYFSQISVSNPLRLIFFSYGVEITKSYYHHSLLGLSNSNLLAKVDSCQTLFLRVLPPSLLKVQCLLSKQSYVYLEV